MESLCPQSAVAITNNEDLLTQILLCLPPQSLLRFKCVSKQWLSLISNSKFCDRHTLQNKNSKISAFFSDNSIYDFYCIPLPNNENPSGFPSEPLNFVQDPAGIRILQSCNGLLLCCSWRRTNTTPGRRYYVLNPTTNHYLTLPATSKPTGISGVALAFDPSQSLHYKVVCVRSTRLSFARQVELEIYSSETRSWRLRKSTFNAPLGIDYSSGVYCNRAIHWIGLDDGELLHYHIDEERFGVVSSSTFYEDLGHRYFGESRGYLLRVESYRPDITQFFVLEMERDYSGWSQKYHVDLYPIMTAFPEIVQDNSDPMNPSYLFVVLFLSREVNEENSFMLLHIPSKLISYNLRDKTFEKLCDLTPKGTTKRFLSVGWRTYHYMETLACV